MADAGLPWADMKKLKSGNASFQDYCFHLRKFSEHISKTHDCHGMKGSIRRLKKLSNWAAHDEFDDTYGHTDVTTEHMTSTLKEFTNIAEVIIQRLEDRYLLDDAMGKLSIW